MSEAVLYAWSTGVLSGVALSTGGDILWTHARSRKSTKARRAAIRHSRALDLAKINSPWLWEEPLLSSRFADIQRRRALTDAWAVIEAHHHRPLVRLRDRIVRRVAREA